ncbi:MAG: FecR domain-containing protein [Agriterribacter sp.]
MTDPQIIQELLKRYNEGTATAAEQEIVEQWLEENKIQHNEWMQMDGGQREYLVKEIQSDLLHYITEKENAYKGPEYPWYRRFYFHLAAASVLILFIVGGWYYTNKGKEKPEMVKTEKETMPREVMPGTNKAVLTLADGGTVELNDAANGVLASQGNTEIRKQGSELVYDQQSNAVIKIPAFNMLTTPRGGQYNLVLPDGTRVWLNAASSIKYPVAFTADTRMVEVKGEVYFEVAQLNKGGKRIPFQVKVFAENGEAKELVEVMGTHFNINAYSEEATVNTTLLEGRVKVSTVADPGENVVLTVAQQARISNGKSSIKVLNNVNTEEVVAWKNGLFIMKKADIPVVLRQLARWYDVDIVYSNGVPAGKITGDIPRNMPLAEVLKVMQLSGVQCKTENRKIIVE